MKGMSAILHGAGALIAHHENHEKRLLPKNESPQHCDTVQKCFKTVRIGYSVISIATIAEDYG